ncbi:competence protein ComEA [Microbacterium paludicola]|uniref:Competence protein ComEA n=1 Tax=Microbacterium paludicola TaxID=300019 RepID=A0A4Y9FZ94_9MICO|nr:helix-hairpin-helix domain-containing protein [Microbacterium paludicola]TFU34753.1 competence protein ComEA [Microbacterium paludicola]
MPEIAAPPRRVRLGLGAVVLLVLGALAVTIGIGVWRGATTPTERVAAATATPGATVAAGRVYVHVDGQVRAPGLYVLPAGSRVVDAIASAGGFGEKADRTSVNLARVVADGEQLVVPEQGAAPPPAAAAGGGAGGEALIDLNTADSAALEELPRIGPALAQRIIEWRDANGRFAAVEDLLAVPGIGEKMLESLRPHVRVG